MHGSCYCGRVHYDVTAPALWCGHCHCSICRRIHGGPLVTWVGCAVDAVDISDPDHLLRWYESTPGADRGSCVHCGTQLFFRSVNWPGELHITRASIEGDCDLEPQGHAFYSSHVDWLTLGDSLPRKP